MSGLYIKLLLSLGVVAIVVAGYFYVNGLTKKVTRLQSENAILMDDNRELSTAIKDADRTQDIIVQVSRAGDKERQRNRAIRDNQIQKIDKDVTEGKDRPVGPLLRDFLNEQ